MSLLMEALRRAEAANAAPRTDDAEPAAPAPPFDLPASNSPLELEPLQGQLPDIVNEATANEAGEPAPLHPAEVAAEVEKTQRQAQAAVTTFGGRKSSLRKHAFLVLSALMTAATIVAGYYFWTSRNPTVMAAPVAATLIATPPASSLGQTGEALAESVGTSVADAAVIQPPPLAREAEADPQTTPPAASHAAQNQPASATQPYRIEIHKSHRPVTVPAALQQAYRAYREQDYPRAEQLYRTVLQTYRSNRDAMLGLAAIALHQGNRAVARYYYERLLKNDPADKTALLGLQGLSGETYSLEEGSKIKYWLQSDANNAQLHFALGNQYAASGQWKEAQQAYFDAQRIEPTNADYAFNLAVSLDQLGLGSQALDYYRQARSLAAKSGALFSSQQLERRIQQLATAVEHP